MDFRGPAERPDTKDHYADFALHAGLACLNGPPGMDLDMQIELFEEALDELAADPDIVNQVLEITNEDAVLYVRRSTVSRRNMGIPKPVHLAIVSRVPQTISETLRNLVQPPEPGRRAHRESRASGQTRPATLVLHLTGAWANTGKRVVVIDADPQGSALDWSEQRAKEALPRPSASWAL